MSDAKRFEAELHRLRASPTEVLHPPTLLKTAVRGQVVVIVYKEEGADWLSGMLVDLPVFSRGFRPRSPEFLADVIMDEIQEPSGRGRRLDVDWAEGLVDEPSAVLWHVNAGEAAAVPPHPSRSGGGGAEPRMAE
ncbi:hypothetical protein [Homoserinibacter sp. YIM 151385]|uniref:hypothetical protein n=1 Tax=Homoserinibacter sp. YIM 151385 TaxID=2985506 RepID=UPI0022F1169B|nr:hypothetical protein [Homoserinibacter sp. YIM 151385]WBU37344.1 hypothetical protein OF852_10515 [Homoserinibacter sp. YIM 151385]